MSSYTIYSSTLLAPSIDPNSQSSTEDTASISINRSVITPADHTIDSMTPCFPEVINLNDYTSCVLTKNATPQETLEGYLSSRTMVSHSDIIPPLFSEIGRGTYGIIFQNPGTQEVVKRPINKRVPDNGFDLWNDFKMHVLIHESFQAASYSKIHIVKPLEFVSANNSEWWLIWRSKFPDDHRTSSNLLFSERILPVPRAIRDALADHLCPEHYRVATKTSLKNQICLIHPLLGRRKGKHSLRGMLNLRNFELCVDQMEALRLDVGCIIDTMAESLAILHFKARVDAHDIEFAFGSAPSRLHHPTVRFEAIENLPRDTTVSPEQGGYNFHARVVHLWMLDFNRVSQIPDTKDFVAMAVKGFVDQSKAYYPRPRISPDDGADNRNWRRFKAAYMRFSKIVRGDVVADADVGLPEQFLQGVEDFYRKEKLRREASPGVTLESELPVDEY